MHSTEFFVDLERGVWQALVDGDAATDTAMLSEAFVGVYPTGVATRAEHADQLRDGPSVVTYEIDEPSIFAVTNDNVMLTYLARFQRPGKAAEAMYVSSLWTRTEGNWLNTFSQDTPSSRAS